MQNLEKTPKNRIIHSASDTLNRLELTKFYVIVSAFIISASVLAIYSTIQITEHNSKKDDAQAHSIVHTVKATDWWNDYQAHKLREKIFQMEIDNLNISLLEQRQLPPLTGPEQPQDTLRQQILAKYQGFMDKLHAPVSTEDSLDDLKHKAETEEKSYEDLNKEVAKNSKLVKLYDFVTILLIIGTSLGGISEIVKSKVLGYAGFVFGGVGVITLLMTTFTPGTMLLLL